MERSPKRFRLASTTISRSVWVLMALTHAPGFIGAWRSFVASGFDAAQLGGCIVMTVAMLFFIFKLRGVEFLRFRTDRRSWVAICLATTLVHVDLLSPELGAAMAPECTKIVGATLLASGLVPVRRALRSIVLHARTAVRSRLSHLPTAGAVWVESSRPNCWVLASHSYQLRAPPR